MKKRKELWAKDASGLLHNMYDCDYSANMTTKYLNSMNHEYKSGTAPFGFKNNIRFWNVCSTLGRLGSYPACLLPEFASSACALCPIR